jgi:hypothetical protein
MLSRSGLIPLKSSPTQHYGSSTLGYFRGPEAFRQEVRSGHLSVLLQQMAAVPVDPDGCSEFERILVGDLELVQKHAQRAFFVQCHLLTGGLLSRARGFLHILKQLHDRSRQA